MRMNSATFNQFPLVLFCNGNHGLSSMVLLLLLLLLPPAIRTVGAQSGSGPPRGSNSNDNGLPNQPFSPSVGVIIIVLIAALFFMGFFSIYIRTCADNSSSGSRNLLVGLSVRSRRGPRGLDAAVIESFPVFVYSDVKNSRIGKGALECAICLNEFEDDETLRLITKCDHVFHTDCIDSWLVAHTTCPVCRANLVPQPGESTHAANELEQINEHSSSPDDVILEVSQQESEAKDEDNMERPLHPPALSDFSQRLNRNRTWRNMSGRPRWLGRFSRSNSTGHVAVKQWENMDRFTLRVPEEVRRQIMSGKLRRSTSLVVLPREGSSRRGYRAGYGEGSSRGRFSSARLDRAGGRSDRWVFSLAPPFISRTPSTKSPKVAASGGESLYNSNKTGNFAESVNTGKVDSIAAINAAVESSALPV
ncbi:hypothetical protein Ancab_024136 [Ancistrocladus abbreviatus]